MFSHHYQVKEGDSPALRSIGVAFGRLFVAVSVGSLSSILPTL